MKLWLVISALIVISGCKYEGQVIQKRYFGDRKECRQFTEDVMGGVPRNPNKREQVLMVQIFAKCMNRRGWAVNDPTNQGGKEGE